MEQIIALIDRSLRPYINDAWRGQAAETVAEALKPWLGGRGAENVGGARENQWPDNIVAHRHETTGKWVLYYLTDEQAEKCRRVLAE